MHQRQETVFWMDLMTVYWQLFMIEHHGIQCIRTITVSCIGLMLCVKERVWIEVHTVQG